MAGPVYPNDSRQRPVVFETHAPPAGTSKQQRKPLRVLTWITLVFIGAAVCCGVAVGGTAVWAVVGPKSHGNAPEPLWVSPPTIAVHHDDNAPPPTSKIPALPGNNRTTPHSSSGGTNVEPRDTDRGGSGRPVTTTTSGHGSTGSGSGSESGSHGGGSDSGSRQSGRSSG